MISNINSQALNSSAIETNKNSATTQVADSQSTLKSPNQGSPASTPSAIVQLSGATAPEAPVTYSFARGTSGGIGKPPPSQTQETLEYTTKGTSGGIGKPPPEQSDEPIINAEGTSGGIGKPPP